MKEKAVEDDHILQARRYGGVCIKGEFAGRSAYPDQLVLKPDKTFYWIEFKVPGNGLQDDQVEMHRILKAKGHRVYLCDNQADSDAIIVEEF